MRSSRDLNEADNKIDGVLTVLNEFLSNIESSTCFGTHGYYGDSVEYIKELGRLHGNYTRLNMTSYSSLKNSLLVLVDSGGRHSSECIKALMKLEVIGVNAEGLKFKHDWIDI